MNIFTFVWVAICVAIGVATGILIAKVLILEDKQRELEVEVYRQKQDIENFKKQINDLSEDKSLTYDWLCEIQDDLDDLKRWSSDTENDLNNTMNSLSEVREATSYRGY